MNGNPLVNNRIRDALRPRDDDALAEPTALRTGTVASVSKVSTPWTVTVTLPDGTVTAPMLMAGWYDPVVNDQVVVLQQGQALFCLGGYAGAAKVVATTAALVTPPAPATPPPPPAAQPTLTTTNIPAVTSACWSPSWGGWRTDNDDPRQGGTTAQRGFWFYGNAISTAKGSGTILSGKLYMARRQSDHGSSGQATVRLGVHSFATQPGSGAGSLSSVYTPAALYRGEDITINLSTEVVAALNAGALGFGLEPGALGTSSTDYLVALGKGANGASGQLQLVVQT